MFGLELTLGSEHFIALYFSHFGIREDLNTRLAVFLQKDLHDVLVEVRQDGWHRFDNGDRHAELVVERSELHTDHATAHDDHRLREFLGIKCRCRIPYGRVILDARDRWYEIVGARTDEQVLCLVLLFSAGDDDGVVCARDNRGSAHDNGTMLVVEALFDTRYEFAHDLGLALSNLSIIECHIVGRDTVLGGVLGVVVLFGTIEQRFGRDTAHIETGAAEGGLLKEDDIFACTRGDFCGSVARRATADNSEKVFHMTLIVLVARKASCFKGFNSFKGSSRASKYY